MTDIHDSTLVKWVCNECGSNNMSHKALVYQCMVCNKIRSTEPLMFVNSDKVLEPLGGKVTISLNKSNWYVYFNILFEKAMYILARTLQTSLVILSVLSVLFLFLNHESWNEVFYNIGINIQGMKNDIYLEGIEQMVQHCQNCLISIPVTIVTNIMLIANNKLFVKSDMMAMLIYRTQDKLSMVLQNRYVLQTGFVKRIMNVMSIFPVLVLHMKGFFDSFISNVITYYHSLYVKLLRTKAFWERKFSK